MRTVRWRPDTDSAYSADATGAPAEAALLTWHRFRYATRRSATMVMFLVILLVILWLLGMVTTTTLGGWLHILLVIAIVFLLIRVIRGQRV
jgi:hypothetical protein